MNLYRRLKNLNAWYDQVPEPGRFFLLLLLVLPVVLMMNVDGLRGYGLSYALLLALLRAPAFLNR